MINVIEKELDIFKSKLKEDSLDIRFNIVTGSTLDDRLNIKEYNFLLAQLFKLLQKFLNKCTIDTNSKLSINIYEGYSRCLARIYDQYSSKPDIHKRCRSKACPNYDLCNFHMTKEGNSTWCGRVTEYPDEEIIVKPYFKREYYKNNIIRQREFNNNISLQHSLLCKKRKIKTITSKELISYNKTNIYVKLFIHKNKNLKLKNNIMYNSKMFSESSAIESKNIIKKYKSRTIESENRSAESENIDEFYDNLELYGIKKKDYTDKVSEYVQTNYTSILTSQQDYSIKQFSKEILKQLDINMPTQQECFIVGTHIKSVFDKIKLEKQYEEYSEKKRLDFIKTVDIFSLDSIRFIDNNYSGYELYYYTINGKNILYNSNRKMIGYLRDWIDDEEEVPNEFKTIDNKVLHPLTKLPVLEVEITKKGSGFEPIEQGIYREFEYIDHLETLCNTNQIIRNQ